MDQEKIPSCSNSSLGSQKIIKQPVDINGNSKTTFGKIYKAQNPKKTGNNKRTKATWRKYVINNE